MSKFNILFNRIIFESSFDNPDFITLNNKYFSSKNVICKYSSHSIDRVIERTFIENEDMSISEQEEKIKENIGAAIDHIINDKNLVKQIKSKELSRLSVEIRVSTKKFNNKQHLHLIIPMIWKAKINKFNVIIKTIYFSKNIQLNNKINHPTNIVIVIDGI